MDNKTYDIFTDCIKPIQGTDINIWAHNIAYSPCSFLTLGTLFPADHDTSPYLPHLPPPTYLQDIDLYVDVNYSLIGLRNFWTTEPNGKLVYIDKEMLEQSKGIFLEIVAKMAKSLFKKNIQGLSMPVRLNECRGFTDKVVDFLRSVPIFLNTAGKTTDFVERVKLYTAASISALNMTLARAKVFEAFSGETTEASLSDGTKAYVECTCPLPQTANYYVVGANFKMDGRCLLLPSMGFGYVEIDSNNYQRVIFNDEHILEYISFPSFRVTGLVFGKRRMVASKKLVIEDKLNCIRSIVYFMSDNKKSVKDGISGIIYKYKSDPSKAYLKSNNESDLRDVETVYGKVSGRWTECVTIGESCYWKWSGSDILDLKYEKKPIPSDFSYREDIIWIKRKNLKLADAWKDSLELRHKKDMKLRKKK